MCFCNCYLYIKSHLPVFLAGRITPEWGQMNCCSNAVSCKVTATNDSDGRADGGDCACDTWTVVDSLHWVIIVTLGDHCYTGWSLLHWVITVTLGDHCYTGWSLLHWVIIVILGDHCHTGWSLLHWVIIVTLGDHCHIEWSLSYWVIIVTLGDHCYTGWSLSYWVITVTLGDHCHTGWSLSYWVIIVILSDHWDTHWINITLGWNRLTIALWGHTQDQHHTGLKQVIVVENSSMGTHARSASHIESGWRRLILALANNVPTASSHRVNNSDVAWTNRTRVSTDLLPPYALQPRFLNQCWHIQ